jgi:hypothetical protein
MKGISASTLRDVTGNPKSLQSRQANVLRIGTLTRSIDQFL